MNWKKPVFALGAVLLCTSLLMAITPPGTTATATQIAPVSANSTQAVLPDPVKTKALAKAQGQAVTGPIGLAPTPGAKPAGLRSGEECPPDALFGQIPHGPDDAWSIGTSADTTAFTYMIYENYSGVTGEICDIHWWGLSLHYDAGWTACDPEGVTFNVAFYEDDGGVPGAMVCTYTDLTPTITGTGLFYAGFEMYYWEVLSLDPCCTLGDGWVSIQSQMNTNDCAFLWHSSPEGDGESLQEDLDAGTPPAATGYDRAFCLTGVYEPTFGACCDDYTGVCEDDVEIIYCDGRFAADTLCADLDPPCGPTGACCVDLVCVETTVEAACDEMGGDWYEGETCPEFECPDTLADFIVQAPFTSDLLDSCGAGDDCALRTGEEHEYEVIIPYAGLWNFNTCLHAGWDTYIFLGTTLCGQELGYNDDACGLQSEIEVFIEAGNYFCTIEGFSGCGLYIFDVFDATPLGACCVDTVCVETNYPADCDALGGDWYQGETCPEFDCPVPCEESTVEIEILTDSWPEETTWVVVPHGGGTPICSGGPYADAATTYLHECCIGYEDCVDFTIYDSYGDGIYAPGGYIIRLDGVEVANTMGGGFTDSEDTVYNFGGGCVPDVGACCVGLDCVATNTEAECDAIEDGDWYIFEDCFGTPPFDCPEVPANDDCEDAEPVNAPYPVTVLGDNTLATIDCPGVLDWIAIWYEVELPYADNTLSVSYCPTGVDLYTVGIVYYNDCTDCNAYIIADTYAFTYDTCPGGWTGCDMQWNSIAGPGTIVLPAYLVDASMNGMEFNATINVTENVPCVIDCEPNEGEEICYDGYVDDYNGGCNSTPPVFQPIACGDIICGTSGIYDFGGSAYRDMDWFEFTLDEPGMVTWAGEAEFFFALWIAQGPCDNLVILDFANAPECTMISLTQVLDAGDYILIAAPADWGNYPCGVKYEVSLTCGIVTGACCVGTECVDTNEQWECDDLGGDWYIGEDCFGDPPFECPVPCDESQIDITILTDSWPSETTWEVTDHATGVLVCSGGPYSAAATTYYEVCCIGYDDCVDFTIYDSFGDGIYAPGGYIVALDGVEIANQMGGGFTGSVETVENIGGGCVEPIGACCDQDLVCVATNTEEECDALGYAWYIDEDCFGDPPFECPPCEYCTPCYSDTDDDFITNVTFNTINNDTGPEGAPCSYGSYIGISTEVELEETYQLSVSIDGNGSWTEYVSVWFDWNQDCTLDTVIQLGSVVVTPGTPVTITADITIPADAVLGVTRMRVIERYAEQTTDPCEVYTYGEAEDYTVVVMPSICGDFDGDGDVDVDDFYFFLDAFGTCVGDDKYEEACDFDGDECITLVDYQMWMECYRDANGKQFTPVIRSSQANHKSSGKAGKAQVLP